MPCLAVAVDAEETRVSRVLSASVYSGSTLSKNPPWNDPPPSSKGYSRDYAQHLV